MEGTVAVITSSSFYCLLLHLPSLLIFNETFFFFFLPLLGFPVGSDAKESACNAGDLGHQAGIYTKENHKL